MLPINTTFIVKGTSLNLDSASFKKDNVKFLEGRFNNLKAGQQLTGEIQSIQDDGYAKISLNDIILSAKLPVEFGVGNRVSITVIEAGMSPVIKIEAVASEAPTLSLLGKDISKFLMQADRLKLSNEITGTTPVIASTSMLNNKEGLAHNLQETIEKSGLFYESHLAKWFHGKISTSQIFKEPQASLIDKPNYPKVGQSNYEHIHNNLPESLSTLVNAQLQTLESQSLAWFGDVWPGQAAHWKITKDPNSHSEEEESIEKLWSTSISLELPNLGKIDVLVSLSGNNIQLKISSSEPLILQSYRDVLTSSLLQSDITTTRFSIKSHDE